MGRRCGTMWRCGAMLATTQRSVAVGFGWGDQVVLMDNFMEGGKDSKSFVINKLK
jgi:hypothetical protein